jgi:hypothetical protein
MMYNRCDCYCAAVELKDPMIPVVPVILASWNKQGVATARITESVDHELDFAQDK